VEENFLIAEERELPLLHRLVSLPFSEEIVVLFFPA